MSHHGVWSGVVGGVAASVTGVLIASAVSYYTGASIVEVGNVKITAAPRIEDPALQRCKAVQASVENNMRSAFADVKNALAHSMRDTQDKELEALKLWTEMRKSNPDDVFSHNSIGKDIDYYRELHSALQTDVNTRLDYIGQVLDYILTGCGLPARE